MRRLFHGRGQTWSGLEQITADWIGQQLIVTLFKPVEEDFHEQLTQGLLQLFQSEEWQSVSGIGIGLQHRYQHGAPFEVIAGEIHEHTIGVENGLQYQLVLGKTKTWGSFGYAFRPSMGTRACARKTCVEPFSYTCGFSVAAMAGGAHKVLNVDMAKGRCRVDAKITDLINMIFMM